MLRTLFIWLLALALPAQGLMAATMASCGAQHHERMSAMAHGADVAHQAQDRVAQADIDDPAAAHARAAGEAHTCSVCASCCATVALHDTADRLPVLVAATAPFGAHAPAVEPFAAEGPDRPPRRPLA